ncbi:hypothetical protein [Labilithrix luteola]|nr:hypothetical protein [Labilithrix luteola]
MFKAGVRRIGVGVTMLGALVFAACGGDTQSLNPLDGGTNALEDASAPTKDAGGKDSAVEDAGGKDAGGDAAVVPLSCTGNSALDIVGNYVAGDGAQHWIRKTATATTYTRVPAGKADNAKPPTLWKISQVCSDQKAFIATSPTGKFARIDWTGTASALQLCVPIEEAASVADVLAIGATTPGSPTGCQGKAWTTLTAKDGGL